MRLFLLLVLSSFFATPARATIYFAAFDPATKATALVYSSSGAHFWQTLVKGKGLVGAQSRGLCPEATPEVFLDQGLSAPDLVAGVFDQCHSVGWEDYRILAITSDGAIDWAFGANGCSEGNAACGALRAENFAVTGGGLRPGVLEAALHSYVSADPAQPFACRLFNTMKAIYAAGGQHEGFMGASIAIDDPSTADLLNVKSIFDGEWIESEEDLLIDIGSQLDASGFHCE